jgi:hypothetical protein
LTTAACVQERVTVVVVVEDTLKVVGLGGALPTVVTLSAEVAALVPLAVIVETRN